MPAYRAELIVESLWEFIDEDRSVQTRLGREDSEYLARSVPFYAANQPLTDISEIRVVQGMDAGLYQKLKPLVCALPMARQQININTLGLRTASTSSMSISSSPILSRISSSGTVR